MMPYQQTYSYSWNTLICQLKTYQQVLNIVCPFYNDLLMELNESNVTKSLSEIAPYIEADGGFVEFVEIEEETNYVKVRLGGACTSCAMSAMTLKQGIESKIMQDIPDCNGVIQVL